MRSCPNCGGGLKYDIASKQLKCSSCSSPFAIGSVPEARAAKADGSMEAMIFSCPQCGGQIWSTSEIAAGFCSYCGASVQLEGRMTDEHMPKLIAPFSITKEECSKKFQQYVKSYFFAPDDLRKSDAKLEFRGIYMPYWDYTVHQQAHVIREYCDENRRGDYRIIKHYDFSWDLDEDIPSIQHDASSSFDDELGLAIAPFDPDGIEPFKSDYMEGFYGDVCDSSWEDFADFALDEAAKQTERAIDTKTVGIRTDKGSRGNDEFGGVITKKDLSLFPVWFLSYRSGGRVAYSVVNGQTGKVYVDLPVSFARFFALTAALTIGFFVILLMLLTPTPQFDVNISMVMSVAASIIFIAMTKAIIDHDSPPTQQKSAKKPKNKSSVIGFMIVFIAFAVSTTGLFFSFPVIALIASIASVIYYITQSSRLASSNGGNVFPSPFLALLAALLGMGLSIWEPVSDFWYYGITVLSMVAASCALVSVLSLLNMLSTRRLPQFDTHKGGDHRAR